MPLRSNGCYTCRKRKIRCDQERPSCRRCATHGVKCPGYRTEKPGDVEFRDQTSMVLQRATNTTPRWLEYSPGTSSSEDVALRPQVQSPGANRAQFYSAFMDSYIPQNFLPEEDFLRDTHFGWMHMLASMNHTQPALSHALDAMSLIQAGTQMNNKPLMREAIVSYTQGLVSLARALSRPKNVYDDEILASASLLCQCEIYSEIRQHGKGWLGHVQGLQRIVSARGPERLQSRLARMLFYASTRTSLARSLLLRKNAYYSAPEWQPSQIKVDLREDYSDSYRSGQILPGLLERCDELCYHPKASDLVSIDHLLLDCESLQYNMRTEVATLSSQTIKNGKSCYFLADITTFSSFCSLVSDRTLDRAYWFASYATAYLYSQYWLRIFLLRQCMQQVQALRKKLLPSWTPAKDVAVEEIEILGYVVNLCRCIPFLVEPSTGTVGTICTFFPLHVSTQYFQAQEHRLWLRWILQVRNAIFGMGLGIPVSDFDLPDDAIDNVVEKDSIEEQRFNLIDGTDECMSPGYEDRRFDTSSSSASATHSPLGSQGPGSV